MGTGRQTSVSRLGWSEPPVPAHLVPASAMASSQSDVPGLGMHLWREMHTSQTALPSPSALK
jgi:hypothetical protein